MGGRYVICERPLGGVVKIGIKFVNVVIEWPLSELFISRYFIKLIFLPSFDLIVENSYCTMSNSYFYENKKIERSFLIFS